jgi:hypothetical protein
MESIESNARNEYQAIKGDTVTDLLIELDDMNAEGWEPKLYLGQGVVILQRPFTGTAPDHNDEIGDLNLTDEEVDSPLVQRILAKHVPMQ